MELSNSSAVKTPDAESEAPTRIQPVPPPPSSNGVLKRHPPVLATYKECLRNHAASLGGHSLDGCGEFIPSPAANLTCDVCGCHRNFHRREAEDQPLVPTAALPAIECHPHHRHQHHHSGSPDNSPPPPPPISSSYYPYAPRMLLALSHGLNTSPPPLMSSNGRKRFRTKFTQNQKEKMLVLAEKVGWKIQKKDEELINGFCSDVGIERGVLKVWMHNNKNNYGNKDQESDSRPPPTTNAAAAAEEEDSDSKESVQLQDLHHDDDDNSILGTTNA